MLIKLKKKAKLLGLGKVARAAHRLASKIASYRRWKSLMKKGQIWLELGSGNKKGVDGWTTVDLTGSDICHDLSSGIPLPDGSVERIYTSHMLEHIPYKSLIIFIEECYRVMKVGGSLSVCVPNAGLYIKAYAAGERFIEPKDCYFPALVETGSLIDQINYIAYMDGLHNYLFDEEGLLNTLKKSPFRSVSVRNFDEKLDLRSRKFESIYALAIK